MPAQPHTPPLPVETAAPPAATLRQLPSAVRFRAAAVSYGNQQHRSSRRWRLVVTHTNAITHASTITKIRHDRLCRVNLSFSSVTERYFPADCAAASPNFLSAASAFSPPFRPSGRPVPVLLGPAHRHPATFAAAEGAFHCPAMHSVRASPRRHRRCSSAARRS